MPRSDVFGFMQEELHELYYRLSYTSFSIQATGLPYRVINHWDSKGILGAGRDDASGWRRFNWFEIAWLKLCSQLREFGLSLDALVKMRGQLFLPSIEGDKDEQYSPFEFALLTAILQKQAYFLLTDAAGSCQITSTIEQFKEAVICLPLAPIVQLVLQEEQKLQEASSQLEKFSGPELEVLKAVQEGSYNRLIISYGDRRPLILSEADKARLKTAAISSLKAKDYQSVMLLRDGGKVISLKPS